MAAEYKQIPSGAATLNFNLESLCLKIIMPIIRPTPPPNREKLSKNVSESRHLFLTAYDLSSIIATHATRLIKTKAIVKNLKSILPPQFTKIDYITIYIF